MLPKNDPDFKSNNWIFDYRFPINQSSQKIKELVKEINHKKNNFWKQIS